MGALQVQNRELVAALRRRSKFDLDFRFRIKRAALISALITNNRLNLQLVRVLALIAPH